jgi:prepilin-type N-terminal cleavage/methylation domain-containing protein
MKAAPAFALIEVLIAIAIIAILASIVVPNFQARQPRYERELFIARLNSLVYVAWQQAIMTRAVHKVSFNFSRKVISIAREVVSNSPKKEPEFKPVTGQFFQTTLRLPENIKIQQFILEGFDEMKRSTGQTNEVWFFIIPDGLTQMVTINALDMRDTTRNKPRQFSLVLNPFNAQFMPYDTFQK